MPAQIVVSAAALTAGLRNDFVTTYRTRYAGMEKKLASMMALNIPSDKLTEFFAYPESAAHPRRWDRGEAITRKPFRYIGYNVTNFDWGLGIDWHKNDRMDDQTQSLGTQAKQGGTNFALLRERILYQILLGSTDPDLLPTIPNAPDGVAIYSATDGGGGARFGATGGNIVTGTGVASSDAIRTDFFTSMARFINFQDTEGQPLIDESILDVGVTVTYGAGNSKVFADAFVQGRTLEGGAAVTNIIMDSGQNVTLVRTQRITDNDWFIFANGIDLKPTFHLNRQGLEEHVRNMDNSDVSKDTKIEGIQWDERSGYGVNLPIATIKVDN